MKMHHKMKEKKQGFREKLHGLKVFPTNDTKNGKKNYLEKVLKENQSLTAKKKLLKQ